MRAGRREAINGNNRHTHARRQNGGGAGKQRHRRRARGAVAAARGPVSCVGVWMRVPGQRSAAGTGSRYMCTRSVD